MLQRYRLSRFTRFLAYMTLLFATEVLADSADAILGTWVGFDNNNFPGQLRSVDLDLQIDSSPAAATAPPGQEPLLTTEGEMVHLAGRMTTSYLDGRANNLNFAEQVFDVRAAYIPAQKVLLLYPYGEPRSGASAQQLAVLSPDGHALAFIQTPRSSGWPLPWVLSRKNHTDAKLNELAAIKMAGANGGTGINTLSVTLQNFKPRMTQPLIDEYQQAVDELRLKLAAAILSQDIDAINALNKEANEKSKAMAQAVILSGNLQLPQKTPDNEPQACPAAVLSWLEAVESGRESTRFDSFLEVFNAFRPEMFTAHFGKAFLDMSEAERTALFFQMDKYCARSAQVRRSQFYKQLQYALWGGFGAGTSNSFGPFTAATGVQALEIFEVWQQAVVSAVQATNSPQQADSLANTLTVLASSFWAAKAEQLKHTADELAGRPSAAQQEAAALASVAPVTPKPAAAKKVVQVNRSEVVNTAPNKPPAQPQTNNVSPKPQNLAVSNTPVSEQRPTGQAKKTSAGNQSGKVTAATLLELEGQLIALHDSGCILGGCTETCQSKPDICPGGEEAAKTRGAWESCSGGDWSSENCQIIISRYGKHSQLTPITVPDNYQAIYAQLKSGQAFTPNEANLAFVSGLGGYLTDTCQILGPKDAQVINRFARAGKTFATMGNNYMNPGENFGKATSAALTMKAGIELGQNIACRLPEAYMLAKSIVESIKASEGVADNEPSRFVSSCARTFSQTQCQCLADIGRATISDIHTRSYHRNIITEMIERNPMLGFAVGFQCKIYNY